MCGLVRGALVNTREHLPGHPSYHLEYGGFIETETSSRLAEGVGGIK